MKDLKGSGDFTAPFDPSRSPFSRSELWAKRSQGASPSPLASFLQKLSEQLPEPSSARWKSHLADRFRSLSGEKDPEMFFFQLLTLGRELKRDGEDAMASALFQAFNQEAIPQEIREAAKKEFQAMSGEGETGLRVEYLGSRFFHDAINYKMIVPMLLGSAAYGALRAASFSRLAGGAGMLSRGWGLRFGSSAFATALEIPVFALSGRALHRLAGDPVRENVAEDLASAGITLSALKCFAWAGKSIGAKWTLPVSTFLGLFTAQHLETYAGLRKSSDGATTVTDILASMVSLGVGSHLGGKVLGSKFAAFQREMEIRSKDAGEKGVRPFTLPALARPAGGGRQVAVDPVSVSTRGNPLFPATWMIRRSADLGGPGGGGKSTTVPGSTKPDVFLDSIQQRADSLPIEVFEEVRKGLEKEWERWKGKKRLAEETQRKIEGIFPHYARFSLALLGRETPPHLSFVREVFQVALEAYLANAKQLGREIDWTDSDRIHFNRFLSSQEGRKDAGIGHESPQLAPLSLPGIPFAKVRQTLQDVYIRWERFLHAEVDKIQTTPFEKAKVYQRARNLLHFYASYLCGRFGEGLNPADPEQIFQADLIQQTLQDASKHPYSRETVEIFDRFFREELGIDIPRSLTSDRPPSVHPADLSLQALSTAPLNFVPPLIGERWDAYLIRLGFNRNTILPPDWGLAGATVLTWGTQRDSQGRIKPPGKASDLNSLLHYLNAEHDRAIDPFDMARLTLPEQLVLLRPDPEGRIVIRYPDLMAGLDYRHFGLGNLLQAYLRRDPDADDMDLARPWKSGAQTVKAHREGTSRKMRISKLEPLVDSLVSPDPEHPARYQERRAQMLQLLTFLRYRAEFFDPNMIVEDADGNPLNPIPAQPSQYRIVLVPHHVQLRPLDLTRRIRFEREPFASAINGTVDLALNLLEDRREEFAILGYTQLNLSENFLTLDGLQDRTQEFRDQHGLYFQLLSQHERSPGVVRPGQLREIQDFYRELFRFFEAVHLYARPEGELVLDDARVSFEVVPMTSEQPYGIRIKPNPRDPTQLRAYVVAADLMEAAKNATLEERGEFLKMWVLSAFLRKSQNLMMGGRAFDRENRRVLQAVLRANGVDATPAKLDAFFHLESGARPATLRFDYTTEAILHRITRGHLGQSARVRRTRHWEQELQAFALIRGLSEKHAQGLSELFHAYLLRVPQPFAGFSPEQLRESLAPLVVQEGETLAAEVEALLKDLMKSMGLPLDAGIQGPSPTLSAQGLAEVSVASYLNRCQSLHPMAVPTRVVIDPVLMERVVDDRLVDFPQLTPHREMILQELENKLILYNQRPALLKVHDLSDENLSQGLSWKYHLLPLLYARVLERAEAWDPGVEEKLSPAGLFGSLKELEPIFLDGKEPNRADLELAIDRTARRLWEWGVEIPADALETLPGFLESLSQVIAVYLRSLDRLASLIPDFVKEKRVQSGLEPTEQVGARAQEIFRRYFHKSILEADPPDLQEVILEVIGSRFEPYSNIRGDVVRGMSILFFNGLKFLRNEYDEIGKAVELSAAERPRNEEQFWQILLDLAAMGDRALQSREDLEKRIQDFERFFSVFPFAPTAGLSVRIEEVLDEIREIHSQPLPIESILLVPVPEEVLATYPELDMMDAGSLRNALEQYGREIPILTQPEGRALLQLVAYLHTFLEFFTVGQNEAIAGWILEIQTAPSHQAEEDVTRQIFSQYSQMQREILSQLPAMERLRRLPQFRGEGGFLSAQQLGPALVASLVNQQLPPQVEKGFWKACLEIQGAILEIQDADRHGLVVDAPGMREAVALEFYNGLAALILNHFAAISASPRFAPVSAGGKPLRPENVPQALRDRLALEAPEIFTTEEPTLEDFQNDPEYMKINRNRLPVAEGFLLERIFAMISNDLFSEMPSQKGFLELYLLKNLLIPHGLDPALVAARLTEPMLALYQEHRAEIQNILIKKLGVEGLVYRFPEIQNHVVQPLSIPTGEGKAFANPDRGEVSRLLNFLIHLPLPAKKRQDLDQLLWDFESPLPVADEKEMNEYISRFENRFARYFLKHREELLKLSMESEAPVPARKRRSLEAWKEELWELPAVDLAHRMDLETVYRQNHLTALAQWKPGGSQRVIGYGIHGTSEHTIQGIALLTPEQVQEWEKARKRKKSYPLDYPGKKELPPDEEIPKGPLTPLVLQEIAFKVLMPWPINLMAGIVVQEMGTVAQEYRKANGRAALLLLLNADPEWVLAHYEEKIFQLYDRQREKRLPGINFVPTVENLPEVAGVPDHAIAQQAKDPSGRLPLADWPSLEILLRIQALLHNAGRQNPDLESIWRIISTASGVVKPDEPLRVLSREHANASAAKFLKNRGQILPYLEAWPEPPLYSSVVEEVSQYLEILFIPKSDVRNFHERFLAANPRHLKADKLSTAAGDTWYRILFRMKELEKLGFADLVQEFHEAVGNLSTSDEILEAAQWYKSHRSQIRQLLTGGKTIPADPVKTVSEFSEIKKIPSDMLQQFFQEEEEKGAASKFGYLKIFQEEELQLFLRIMFQIKRPGSSDAVKRKFDTGVYQLQRKGKMNAAAVLRFAAEFYLEYHPKILNPALAAPDHPQVQEVGEYAELNEIDPKALNYPEGVRTPAAADLRNRLDFLIYGTFEDQYMPASIVQAYAKLTGQYFQDEDFEINLARFYKKYRTQIVRALIAYPGAEEFHRIVIQTINKAAALPEIQGVDSEKLRRAMEKVMGASTFDEVPESPEKKISLNMVDLTTRIHLLLRDPNIPQALREEYDEFLEEQGPRNKRHPYLIAEWHLRNRQRIPFLP